MRFLVEKTADARNVVYRISCPGQIVVRKNMGPLAPVFGVSRNALVGAGMLFNIPGKYPIHLRPASTDYSQLRRDWERVGMSIYDGAISLMK